MKHKFQIGLFLLCISVFVISCGKTPVKENLNNQNKTISNNNSGGVNKKPINKDKTNDTSRITLEFKSIDTVLIAIDTLLVLPKYTLAITREKYEANHKKISSDDRWFNPITVYVIKKENDSVVYKQKFEENQFVTLYSFKNISENYISLSTNGGGSGFISTIYNVETERSINFKKVFTYDELSYYTFNNDGSEILCLQGIWATLAEGNEGEINETHFADHAYEIFTINLSTTKPKLISYGTTSYKYPSEDSGTTIFELLSLIQKKEPNICKNIHLDKYPTK